jgi:hypothetical protein
MREHDVESYRTANQPWAKSLGSGALGLRPDNMGLD